MAENPTKVREVKTEQPDSAVYKLAGILLVGALMPLFDTTIVNVALHTLSRDLHTSVSVIQWVVTSYLLALGMAVPVTGWAVERFGGKRMWLVALALFLVGSVLSSLSWSVGSLIAFRALQGIGGGLIMPIMQTLIVRGAGGRKLGRLMAVISLPAVLGPILGPVLGGLIVGSLNWRWIFLVNVPLGVAALLLAWRGLPTDEPGRRKPPLDLLGLGLLSPALVALIYGLAQVGPHGGFASAAVIVPLILGAVLLAGFAIHALRTKETPLVDLRLFRVRSFTAASSLMFLTGLSLYGAMLLLPLYYQQVRGQSVLAAGLLLAPQGIGSLLSRLPAGNLSDRLGARWIVLSGIALAAVGTLPFALAGPHTSPLLLAVALVVRGGGLSAAMVPVMAAAYQGLRRDQIPHASSATRIMQQIGGAFGAAVLAVLLQHQLASHAADIAGRAGAFDYTFWWTLGFTALALAPALFLPGMHKARARAAGERRAA